MLRPEDGNGKSLQMKSLDEKLFNKQLRTADKSSSYNLGGWV